MAIRKVQLKDGRSALIDTANAPKGTSHISASIEGAPFVAIRKSKIAPSNNRRTLGSLGEALLVAANKE